ncbi:MAG: precorrin-2 C(20)-methyltransferase [Rhizobiaceae bacterium]|nr:precorrin-2 C(20)-methyltransferase [Rhizobiaceae bacterium]
MSGKLYGIGVGPGDPELLTLKAHRILTSSKVVAYPAPDDGVSFARSIVAEFFTGDQKEIPIVIPMRVERFPAARIYDEKSAEIASHLRAGEDVVVLCEGDPFFYGSFMYLFERLADEFECEIVPGVSSLMASAAALQRPLAARNDVLTICPAPLEDDLLLQRFNSGDAIAIIKIGRHFSRVRDLIEKAGLLNRAGYLERVTLENQQVMPLAQVSEDKAPYFSMILIYKGAEDWIKGLEMPVETN